MLVISADPNWTSAAVSIFCGVDNVIDPAPGVTVIWFTVPVKAATDGTVPVLPITSCPLVAADKEVSTPSLSAYIKAFSVRPVSPALKNVGDASVLSLASNVAIACATLFISSVFVEPTSAEMNVLDLHWRMVGAAGYLKQMAVDQLPIVITITMFYFGPGVLDKFKK